MKDGNRKISARDSVSRMERISRIYKTVHIFNTTFFRILMQLGHCTTKETGYRKSSHLTVLILCTRCLHALSLHPDSAIKAVLLRYFKAGGHQKLTTIGWRRLSASF